MSRPLSLLAAMIGFIGCTIKRVTRRFYVAPLLVLGVDDDRWRVRARAASVSLSG